jgi:hypothetical protein
VKVSERFANFLLPSHSAMKSVGKGQRRHSLYYTVRGAVNQSGSTPGNKAMDNSTLKIEIV